MAKCSPLHNVTDATRWDAEDLFGRLCIVVHAAFLYAGFHPISAPAATPWSLSRRYSVLPPQAAPHQDAAAIVVLQLHRPRGRRRRGRAHIVLRAHVMANGGVDGTEKLDRATLRTILAGGVDGTAREIRASGSAGECLWKLISEGICRGMFLYACQANGVPVMPDFASLPGDIKVAILEKLDDGKDVAMAECASKELRDLVAGHDSVLWKPKYEAIISTFSYLSRMYLSLADKGRPLVKWKERYTKAKNSKSHLLEPKQSEPNPILMFPIFRIPRLRLMIPKPIHETRKPTANIVGIAAQRRAVMEENRRRSSSRRTNTMISNRSYRK